MVKVKPLIQPLSADEIHDIYWTGLEILEEVGAKVLHGEVLKKLEEVGADVDYRSQVVKFPPSLVKECLRRNPKAKDGYPDLHVGVSHRARYVFDPVAKTRRPGTTEDVRKITMIQDSLDLVSRVEGGCFPQEVSPIMQRIKTYEIMLKMNPQKPCGYYFQSLRELDYLIRMREVAARKDPVEADPYIVSPLQFNKMNMDILLFHMRKGANSFSFGSMPTLGMTAPATMAGTLALRCAENFAAITITQSLKPGCCVSVGYTGWLMDPRTGYQVVWGPEFMLMLAAGVQMQRFLGIPPHMTPMRSDNLPFDQFFGFERGTSWLWSVLAGNPVIAAIGAGPQGLTCLEQHIIDHDIVSAIVRLLEGIEVNQETLALEVVKEMGIHRPGATFLKSRHTRKHVRDLWIPKTCRRMAWEQWEMEGKKDVFQVAREEVDKILRDYDRPPLNPDIQRELDKIVKEAERDLLKQRETSQ